MDGVKVVKGDNESSEGHNHAPTITSASTQDYNSQDVPDYSPPIDIDPPRIKLTIVKTTSTPLIYSVELVTIRRLDT